MKPSGEGRRKILFLGESPGEKEDQLGEQFVGKTGQHLRSVLSGMGVDLDECWKHNSIACRPEGNVISDVNIDSCRPLVLKAIRDLKPHVIILLGASSIKSLMPTERDEAVGSITKWVGWRVPSHEHQAWLCPTYHPSYISRMDDPVLDRIWKGHLRAAIKLEKDPVPGENLDDLKKKCEIITSPREGRLRLRDLSRKSGILAFDYETTGYKPDHESHRIVSVSFCFEGNDTWAMPLDSDAMEGLSGVLKRERLRKVGSNIKFEERWTLAKLGHPVSGWYWDTMLAAHTLDNRSDITGLKFQAFINFGIADYDSIFDLYREVKEVGGLNRIHEMPIRDLLVYNSLDSLLTFKLMTVQRKAMGLR